MREILPRRIYMKFVSMLSLNVQSETHRRFNCRFFCSFNIEPYYSDMCVYHRCRQSRAEICRRMGICCGFRAVAVSEIYPGFGLLFPEMKVILHLLVGLCFRSMHTYIYACISTITEYFPAYVTLIASQHSEYWWPSALAPGFQNETLWVE